jgi:bis(5'-adenosyl)-triphosphatase
LLSYGLGVIDILEPVCGGAGMVANDCEFCNDAVSTYEFAGNKWFAAIYNIAPIVPGHSLVVPRMHIQRVSELPENIFCGYWLFARKVTAFLLSVFKTEAYDWTVQEQEAAGQTVPHLHLHVIPRVPGDFEEPGDWYPKLRSGRIVDHSHEILDSNDRVRLTSDERKKIASELSKQWSVWNRTD